ncbi:MAG: pyrroline-5-carboxylate reductase [Firmicutes bacterium]|nr:pyrroline-5-carboxylate reductase [Bacillota bacterium]
MKYGFIGGGNMASAIIGGMLKSGISPEEIAVYDASSEAMEILSSKFGVDTCSSQNELIEKSGVVTLSVKPNVLDNIIDSVKANLNGAKKLIISIAAGKTIEYLESHLGAKTPIARVMPNINAKVLMAVSGYCVNSAVEAKDTETVERIFKSIGTIAAVDEKHFGIFMAIASSSPAFSYIYINALAAAAQKAGMPKKQALKIAAAATEGSAHMIWESGEHPWELADSVCSPGGTTIEGVSVLEDRGFESTVIKAVEAVIEKDLKIQGK